MQTVNIHEAKTHLSRYLERVAQGDEMIIARAGHPLVGHVRGMRAKDDAIAQGLVAQFQRRHQAGMLGHGGLHSPPCQRFSTHVSSFLSP